MLGIVLGWMIFKGKSAPASCELKIKMLQDELKKRDNTINSLLSERKKFTEKIAELEDVVRNLQAEQGGAMKTADKELEWQTWAMEIVQEEKREKDKALTGAEYERFRHS